MVQVDHFSVIELQLIDKQFQGQNPFEILEERDQFGIPTVSKVKRLVEIE
jgi:hypothetical protein